MSYVIRNLIKASDLSASQKRFLDMMTSYGDDDGTNIYPANSTIAKDYGLTVRGAIKMRNEVVNADFLICVKEATSKHPAHYVINVELLRLRKRCEKVVDNKKRGELSSSLGVNSVHVRGELSSSNHPITNHLPCTNTVGIDVPVDNSELTEVENRPPDPIVLEKLKIIFDTKRDRYTLDQEMQELIAYTASKEVERIRHAFPDSDRLAA